MPRTCSKHSKAALLVCLMVVHSADDRPTQAASGFVDRRPPVGNVAGAIPVSPTSGLMLTVNTMWVESFGYRPLRFDFKSLKPAKVDQRIDVEFHASSWNYPAQALVVRQSISLAAGDTTADLSLIAPQLSTWHLAWWTIRVNGVIDKSLSRKQSEPIQNGGAQDRVLSMLQLDTGDQKQALTDRAGLNSQVWFPPNAVLQQGQAGLFSTTPAGLMQVPNLGGILLDVVEDRLPKGLLSYSALDVVLMDHVQLSELAEKSPNQLKTLRRWVETGGSLWIQLTAFDPPVLDKVYETLELGEGPRFGPTRSTGGPSGEDQKTPSPWQWARLIDVRAENGIDFGRARTNGDRRAAARANRETSKDWFAEAELGFGHVTVFKDDWPERFGLSGRRRGAVDHWRGRGWIQRHGLQPDSPNEDFANLFIPDVGKAPVTVFRVLITLFVVVAGPLNLWLLVHKQKTYLMILTVPITAVLLTAGLFAYATLADGFSNRLRARTLSLLDQRSGEVIAWSRLSFYAGFAPSEGLVFDDSVAVYPILSGWNNYGASAASLRERSVRWQDGMQHLERGWLTSRETTQFLAIESSKCEAAVRFSRKANVLSASNQLGADSTLLIAVDSAGEFWLTKSLADGERKALTSVAKSDATNALRTLLSNNEPQVPIGLEESDNSFIQEQRRQMQRQMRRQYNIDYADTTLGGNRMNELLDRLIGSDGTPPLALPPRSYVAVTGKAVTMQLGIDNVEESGSLHVILGRW